MISIPLMTASRTADPATRLVAARRVVPAVRDVLGHPGEELDASVRTRMQAELRHDFTNVRIHADAAASSAAAALDARAFTVGSHIVFGHAAFRPASAPGRMLLRHELGHVVQQAGATYAEGVLGAPGDRLERPPSTRSRQPINSIAVPLIQRQTSRVGPATTGVPADWEARVAAAATAADRAALVGEALGIPVVDRTVESAGDRSPDPAHLVEYSAASRRVNYDDNLTRKRSAGTPSRSLSPNAGYTLHRGSHYYIVLSNLALKGDDFFATRVTLNHEFDHVRQFEANSPLQGDESEVDAWTSSFIREFHRLYTVLVRTNACYIDRMSLFSPLNHYFMSDTVGDAVRDRTVERIVAYHAAVIAGHPIHRRVFRRWVWHGLRGSNRDLPTRVNTALRLGVDPAESGRDNRTLDCAAVQGASFPSGPSVGDPFQPAPGAPGGSQPGRRTGIELRGGASLDPATARAAVSLGVRFSLRSDQMIVVSPSIGAQLLYLPSSGPTSDHVAAAIGEIGLRIQQPVRGFYGDLRVGGFVGLSMPPAAAPRGGEAQPQVEGGFSGAVGGGYRWEQIELGIESRALRGNDSSRVLVLGVGAVRF